MREVKRINFNNKALLNLVEAKYNDYRTKQDLLAMLFEIHKQDEDGSIVSSAPFKAYEKSFSKAKIEFEEIMKKIAETVLPDEFKSEKYHFEVKFQEEEIIISEAE